MARPGTPTEATHAKPSGAGHRARSGLGGSCRSLPCRGPESGQRSIRREKHAPGPLVRLIREQGTCRKARERIPVLPALAGRRAGRCGVSRSRGGSQHDPGRGRSQQGRHLIPAHANAQVLPVGCVRGRGAAAAGPRDGEGRSDHARTGRGPRSGRPHGAAGADRSLSRPESPGWGTPAEGGEATVCPAEPAHPSAPARTEAKSTRGCSRSRPNTRIGA